MSEEKYILALDQGTTSSRAMVIDAQGKVRSVAQRPLPQIFPKPGWVEHSPVDIWETQRGVASEALDSADLTERNIAAIGITNQRETAIVWTGRRAIRSTTRSFGRTAARQSSVMACVARGMLR